MANPYYNHGSYPAPNSAGASASMRAELDSITAGFNKLPTLTANNVVFVNASGTALEARAGIDGVVIGGTTPAAGTFTTLTLTSGFVLPLGSAAAPSLSFTSDSNNGWWSPGADIQAWSTAGLERMRLNAAGAVSISAPSAGHTLTLNHTAGTGTGAINTTDGTVVGIIKSVAASALSFNVVSNHAMTFGTNDIERMRMDSVGNIGIGTSPSNLLHLNAAAGSALIRFSDATPRTLGFLGSGSGIISTAAAADLGLRAEANLMFASNGNNERARIDTSGNLLLGTTTSNGTRLKLDSGTNPWFTFGASSAAASYGQFFRGGTTTIGGYIGFDGGALVGTGTGTGFVVRSEGDLILMASATERVRVNSNGNVGIGVAPQLWGSGRRAVEIGGSGDQSYVMGQNSVNVMVNAYYDGTNFRSVNAAVGGLYQMSTNTHAWFSTSNGGAGGIATLSQNMTLDGSANLGIGAGLTPLRPLHVKSATSEIVRLETTTARGSGQVAVAFNDPTGQKGYVGYGSANDKFEIINQLNADMNFYTNAILAMTLQASGNTVNLAAGAGALRLNSHISRFESAEQSVPTTTFASNTLTHGGSRVPDVCRLVLRCKTAELGYSVGDEVDVTLHNHTMTDRAFNVWHSATQTGYVWITGLNVAPSISHKTTGTMTTVTAANWRVVVYNHWL